MVYDGMTDICYWYAVSTEFLRRKKKCKKENPQDLTDFSFNHFKCIYKIRDKIKWRKKEPPDFYYVLFSSSSINFHELC